MSQEQTNNIDPIARNILILSEKKSMLDSELAKELKVKKASVSNWRHGKSGVSQETINRACTLFGVTEAELRGLNLKQNLTSVEKADADKNWQALLDEATERIEEWKELYREQKKRADRLQAELDAKK